MPSVELMAVGTELLLGQLVDTNTAHVAGRLAESGIDVRATHAVGDNLERISAALRGALARCDGVITTGGLGPTVDDLTKEAVCDALRVDTELYEPALQQMKAFFAMTGIEMRANNVKQAELPRGSVPLPNPYGTAPGFVAPAGDGKFVACMPGVPREMKPMLDERLIPHLRERFALHGAIYTRVLHTVRIGESEIDHQIDDLFRTGVNPKIAVLAHDWRADVKIMAKAEDRAEGEAMIAPVQAEIERRLAGHVYGCDDETLEGVVIARCAERGLRLAVAESCTGGRIATALTAAPGASVAFSGGVVAYDNAVKVEQLGVDPALIQRHGAVSEEVVTAMARGVRERLHAGLAIATTGIAGPSGGTQEKPVGTIWFALDDAAGSRRAWHMQLRGPRTAFQSRATTIALGILWKHLVTA